MAKKQEPPVNPEVKQIDPEKLRKAHTVLKNKKERLNERLRELDESAADKKKFIELYEKVIRKWNMVDEGLMNHINNLSAEVKAAEDELNKEIDPS